MLYYKQHINFIYIYFAIQYLHFPPGKILIPVKSVSILGTTVN